MIEYVTKIILPFVTSTQDFLEDHTPASMGETGQLQRTDQQTIFTLCFLPANAAALLQPIDISINKPTKDFF